MFRFRPQMAQIIADFFLILRVYPRNLRDILFFQLRDLSEFSLHKKESENHAPDNFVRSVFVSAKKDRRWPIL